MNNSLHSSDVQMTPVPTVELRMKHLTFSAVKVRSYYTETLLILSILQQFYSSWQYQSLVVNAGVVIG
jgi:hypothetical protein